jgi:imidazole glycerol-phosphate synthase subunit HisF
VNAIRIIGRLDIKGPNLVKGVHLEGLRVLGQPKLFAEKYYEEGIDELICLDTVASLYGRNNLREFITTIASGIHVPLTVGGGIRSVDDVRNLQMAGADKVAINTAAIKNPNLITEIATNFGSSATVASIEAKRIGQYKYHCFTDNGREPTGVDVLEWAQRVENLGAGEILLTSIDREGTGTGFDIELSRMVAEVVSIPVIISGGCGEVDHIEQVLSKGKADAVAIASIIHYDKLSKALDERIDNIEGNWGYIEQLHLGGLAGRNNISPTAIMGIKDYLQDIGVPVRR